MKYPIKVSFAPSGLQKIRKPIVLAAGFFDGLHLGHAAVIGLAVKNAAKINGEAWCITFDQHPDRVINNSKYPKLLTSVRHRLLLMKRMGLDGCLLLHFTKKMAKTEPLAFAQNLIKNIPTLKEIYTGPDWRFGKGGKGNTEMLSSIAGAYNIKTTVVGPIRIHGVTVSSTTIRECIISGKLKKASALLGRPYSVIGSVRKGRGLARKLGYPTANIIPDNEALPPCGVYSVLVPLNRKLYKGIANLGTRPTFGGFKKQILETHLFEYSGNLYEKCVEVFFCKKIRSEQKFHDLESLKKQIDKDVKKAKKHLLSCNIKESLYIPSPDVYSFGKIKNKN